MNNAPQSTPDFFKLRIAGTAIITVFIASLLLWTHFHGGVPSHHLLHQKELPQISNWWGGLLLPVLAWILLGRIGKRIQQHEKTGSIIRLFIIGLCFGVLLAVSFTTDFKLFLDNVLYILLLLSLIVPIFYAEFILGFVLGMTYTFGAILPTAFVLVMAGVGFLLFRFVRPLLMRLVGRKR